VGSVQERAAEARQAKLEHIRKQISSGALVIRQMTGAERAKWDKQRAILDANFTPAERTRRDSVLRNRRQRAQRLLELAQ
jgi:DNA-binding transcriptional regulator YbjK